MEWIIVYIVLSAMAIYLFLIFPALRQHPDRFLMRGMFVAHRGLHAKELDIPENSLKSYALAKEAGFCIEIDIRLTGDGQVVVFHDSNTKRVCGQDLKVRESTMEQLSSLRLLDTDEAIPTLEQVLSLVSGKVPLLIEFKCDYGESKALCVAADKILSKYKGKYFVQSFYPPVLRWYRKHRPEICRGQLSCRHQKRSFYNLMATHLLFNFIARPDFVSYRHQDAGVFSRGMCTALGAFPVAWTFTAAEQVKAARPLFKTYIFENFLPEHPYE